MDVFLQNSDWVSFPTMRDAMKQLARFIIKQQPNLLRERCHLSQLTVDDLIDDAMTKLHEYNEEALEIKAAITAPKNRFIPQAAAPSSDGKPLVNVPEREIVALYETLSSKFPGLIDFPLDNFEGKTIGDALAQLHCLIDQETLTLSPERKQDNEVIVEFESEVDSNSNNEASQHSATTLEISDDGRSGKSTFSHLPTL